MVSHHGFFPFLGEFFKKTVFASAPHKADFRKAHKQIASVCANQALGAIQVVDEVKDEWSAVGDNQHVIFQQKIARPRRDKTRGSKLQFDVLVVYQSVKQRGTAHCQHPNKLGPVDTLTTSMTTT